MKPQDNAEWRRSPHARKHFGSFGALVAAMTVLQIWGGTLDAEGTVRTQIHQLNCPHTTASAADEFGSGGNCRHDVCNQTNFGVGLSLQPAGPF